MQPLEIKSARIRNGLSQKDIAKKLNLSVGTYQKKESGKIPFTETQKILLSNILGFDIFQMNEFLFDGMLPIGNREEYKGNRFILQ